MILKQHPSSFRDSSGFLFLKGGNLYRQINESYKEHFDFFIQSGLYNNLINDKLIVEHKESDKELGNGEEVYKVISPNIIPFISYPYEWCFSQLKDAALLTLEIQKRALEFGMTLKDCSAYNIQFLECKPIFIDTLSFEKYREGEAWIAYKQFCQHFLAPLALMSYVDIRMNQLFRIHLDGVPLDLASSLLPKITKLKFSLLSHIHLHSKAQKTFNEAIINELKAKHNFSLHSFKALIDNLESSIKKLSWRPKPTEWYDYYTDTHNYTSPAMEHKKELVKRFLKKSNTKTVWDVGANIGIFSKIASKKNIKTIAFDIDPACTEIHYLALNKEGNKNILPLLMDLTNPSPSIGWNNNERMSLLERGSADTILALALVHHLAISNNVPFKKIAAFFNKLCNYLIIEFIPKDDSQIDKLLKDKTYGFSKYTKENFEEEFSQFFTIIESSEIKDSKRQLYLMVKK